MIGVDSIQNINEEEAIVANQKGVEKSEISVTHTHGDRVTQFNEIEASKGSLGRFPGSELISLILQFIHHS